MGWLAAWRGGRHEAADPRLLEWIGRAVDRVDPRLRQVGGFPAAYAKSVAHALDYAHRLADALPGPVLINRETFASDPLVHALFASAEDIQAALCASQAMRTFHGEHPEAREVYAMICMRRGTKALLGMDMVDGLLRRDVPQQAVYFTDHTVAEPGRTEAEARARIAEGFFDSLVTHVVRRIEARKAERAHLEQARDECLARLHGAAPDRRAVLSADLNQILGQLAELGTSLDLRRYIDDFEAVMDAPEQHLYLEHQAMVLDSMGVLRGAESPGNTTLEFCDLTGRDRRRWTVVLMYCNQVAEVASLGERLSSAQRWLGL